SRIAPGKLPEAALSAIFRAPAYNLPAFVGVDLGAAGYSIYRIDKVVDPTSDQIAKRREAISAQVQALIGQEQSAAVLGALRGRAKISTRLQAGPSDTPASN
ncbi:MAG: peptidylprolyl isomerase, partial [Quisquiliibacterium sp.]